MKVLFYLGLTFGLAAAQNATNACEAKDYSGSDVDALLDRGEKTYCAYNNHVGTQVVTFIPGHDRFNLTIQTYGTTYFKTSKQGKDISIGVIEGSNTGNEQNGSDLLVYSSGKSEIQDRWFFTQTCVEERTANQLVVFVKEPTEKDISEIQKEYGLQVDLTAVNSCFHSEDSDSS
ncbi:uncharacterized protein N7483_012591 [Penicillium malachiteum]|uniref:uncharacterized protein n=1 Tax=Penicillium malachiteum TaxID=1324776 RepID=UPI002546E52C|nr:uncharacterized protein N7483_012591 [Penicillium malachiteum]KAJ5715410.1 hypothetical protein N7483_012591 [Penicillium malachiteum]